LETPKSSAWEPYPGHKSPVFAAARHPETLSSQEEALNRWKGCYIIFLEVIREITHKGMIHINVADTQTLVEKSDGVTKYTAYNIYVNGSFHAAVRFSRLIQFAEMLLKFHRISDLPLKTTLCCWFPLDEKGIEQRRIKISNYFNLLAQSPDIVRSLFVERRFLEFQIVSFFVFYNPILQQDILYSFSTYLKSGRSFSLIVYLLFSNKNH
uniref:PX domain-containing protein n=1 Tax=Angiostrongylus cantonensis TaxID=6313 RepID=A0A0K0D7Z3_ANGCA